MSTSTIVLGFHGTLENNIAKIQSEGFRSSTRRGLWLGHGVYFFQDGKLHALRWAENIARRKGGRPAVLQVELDLSECMDLVDAAHWPLIEEVWKRHSETFEGERVDVERPPFPPLRRPLLPRRGAKPVRMKKATVLSE